MTTSPIPSHPSTEVIEKVLDSLYFHLPDVTLFVLCDGVRTPEHEDRRAGYKEYKKRLLKRLDGTQSMLTEWPESVQQAQMFRAAMPQVKTPLTLYIEHDYALTKDPIDWEGIINAIQQERAGVVRFHNLEEIHPLHQHLMLDCFEGATGEQGGRKICDPPLVCGVPMIRTTQFWGCPHLTKTSWYQNVMEKYFTERSYTELEPALYGPIVYAPWEENKLMVYAPSEPSMRRSVHVGGRGHDMVDPKRDFIFR